MRRYGCDPNETHDIARQLVENEVSKKFKIVLAGGRQQFRDASILDEELKPGKRGDKRDLIKEWVDSRNKQGKAQYVYDKNGLKSLDNDTDYILGLFNHYDCPYNFEIVENNLPKPTLTEMTDVAIRHLIKQNNPNGFFLFVEGALIDKSHHHNYARIALDETREFAKAIELARNLTSEDDTLIVVTADHAHTLTCSGYSVSFIVNSIKYYLIYIFLCFQERGSDVLGLNSDNGDDGLPYMTLSYANGPGYYQTY